MTGCAKCFWCGDAATETLGITSAYLCDDCPPTTENETPAPTPPADSTPMPKWGEYTDADDMTVGSDPAGITVNEWLEREQWMCRDGKRPFAPWIDPNEPHPHPDIDVSEDDPRRKWRREYGHWRSGYTALRAAARNSIRVDGVAYLMQPDDGLLFADGDKVVCPETGERHPAWEAFLAQQPATFTAPSSSGTGDHAVFYCPEGFPDGAEAEPVLSLGDEPWGTNDDPPKIELYAGTKVMALTGEQYPDTPGRLARLDADHRDALRCWLEAHDKLGADDATDGRPDRASVTVPDDYEPTATRADETTDEIRDVFAAVDRLTIADLPVTIPSTTGGDSEFTYHDPPYRPSDGGQSLHLSRDGAVFHDKEGGGTTFGPLDWFAYRRGPLPDPRDTLDGGAWWEVVDDARDAGAPIPELEAATEPDDYVPVLPNAPRHRAITGGYDWSRDDHDDGRLTKQEVRDRTSDHLTAMLERCSDGLVEVLPGGGKSYGSIEATARAGVQSTIATGRGREEQYGQYREWCDQRGLRSYTLPSFVEHCDCANGEHGEEWKNRVMSWYDDAGASPKAIHKFAADELGKPLPCQRDGRCPYTAKWDFDADEFDVLIGHYNHIHNQKVTEGRAVFIDESPEDAFQKTIGGDTLARAVSAFLAETPGLPFDEWTDLVEHRRDDDRRTDALEWFDDHGVERDELQAFGEEGGHAITPLAVYTLLASDDLGNGLERATISARGGTVGVYDRESQAVSILNPPSLDYAWNVIGLDGTPTPELWRAALGRPYFDHDRVLEDDERAEYVRDALNMQIVRTTDAVKSYAAGESEIANRVTDAEDAALLEAIPDFHGRKPAAITTKRAWEHVYEPAGFDELVDDHKHYGNILGSNEFADRSLGVLLGSRNFGPDYVKKWGAYLDATVEPTFPGEDGNPLEAGARTDFGETGNQIRMHMTEHETLQALFRYGRSTTVDGAVVYVHTDTLPDWVPIADEGRVIKTWAPGMRQVIEAGRDLGEWSTNEIAEHSAVEINERQIREHLSQLVERGYVGRECVGCGYKWRDDGLEGINDRGDVDLGRPEPSIDTDFGHALSGPVDLGHISKTVQASPVETYYWCHEREPPVDGDPTTTVTARPIDSSH